MSFLKKLLKSVSRFLGLKTKSRRKSVSKARKKSKSKTIQPKKVSRKKIKLSANQTKVVAPQIKKLRSQKIAQTLQSPPKNYLASKSVDKVKRIRTGVITHYFDRIQVAVVRIDAGQIIKGDTLKIIGSRTGEIVQKVSSMQVESVDVAVAKKGQLIGLKVKKVVHVGDEVYK